MTELAPEVHLLTGPENRRSIKRVADLDPALVLVGHGPPLRDVQQLKDLAARLS
jgi:hypothetical protein